MTNENTNEGIKERMQNLENKWKGKPEAIRGSREWLERGFDRLIWESLKERLKKNEDQISIAKKVGLF